MRLVRVVRNVKSLVRYSGGSRVPSALIRPCDALRPRSLKSLRTMIFALINSFTSLLWALVACLQTTVKKTCSAPKPKRACRS